MIADQILPSFYVLELSGDAVHTLLRGDFNVRKVVITSSDFQTDIHATAALQTSIKFLANGEVLPLDGLKEEVEFNPEFYPSTKQKELTEEQQAALVELKETTEELNADLPPGQLAVAIPRVFDIIGDFVAQRWKYTSPTFEIVGRVAVHPDAYVQQKTFAHLAQQEPLPTPDSHTIH